MLTPSSKDNISKPALKAKKMLGFNNQDQDYEGSNFKAPYFKDDLRMKMQQRAKKENLIEQSMVGSSKVDHLGKASKIVQDLLKKHEMAKDKIHKMKEQASKNNDKDLQSKLQKNAQQKYFFRGSMIERNQIWIEQKKRKEIQRREQALMNDLHQCTFSPEISSKKVSQHYLKNKSQIKQTEHGQKQLKTNVQIICPISPTKSNNKKEISLNQFETAKKQIKNRLFTITLRN